MYSYDADIFYNGCDYSVEAELVQHGEYSIVKDGAGQEFYEIDEEPDFRIVALYNEDGDPMDDPEKGLVEAAQRLLEELYWNQELV